MIRDGFLELAHAVPLVTAIAVDDCEIALVVSAGLDGAGAGLDRGVAGSSDANLAVVGSRRAAETNGGDADQSPCDPHEAPVTAPDCFAPRRGVYPSAFGGKADIELSP